FHRLTVEGVGLLRGLGVHQWRGRFYDDGLSNIANLERIGLANTLPGCQVYPFGCVPLEPLGLDHDRVGSNTQEVKLEVAIASGSFRLDDPGLVLRQGDCRTRCRRSRWIGDGPGKSRRRNLGPARTAKD